MRCWTSNPKVDEVLMQMYQAGCCIELWPRRAHPGRDQTIGNVTAADLPDALCRMVMLCESQGIGGSNREALPAGRRAALGVHGARSRT